MKYGLTLAEAKEQWSKKADVICPACNLHIKNNEYEIIDGELYHSKCLEIQHLLYDQKNSLRKIA